MRRLEVPLGVWACRKGWPDVGRGVARRWGSGTSLWDGWVALGYVQRGRAAQGTSGVVAARRRGLGWPGGMASKGAVSGEGGGASRTHGARRWGRHVKDGPGARPQEAGACREGGACPERLGQHVCIGLWLRLWQVEPGRRRPVEGVQDMSGDIRLAWGRMGRGRGR